MTTPSLSNLVSKSRASGAGAVNLVLNERVRELRASGHDIINFSFGQSPFPPMEIAVKALQDNANQTKYEPVKGILRLREAIAKNHAERDSLHFDVDNIVVGPGSKELIFLVMNVFNGDVILPSPAWVTYQPQVALAGNTPVMMDLKPTDGWHVTPATLSEAAQRCTKENKLLIFCNPDNPTGATYSKEDLEALVPVIREHNIVVLSDEIYGNLEFSGVHYSLASVCPERTIVNLGLSKWASCGGWRLGYQAFPKELSELCAGLTHAGSHTFTSASAPIQYAAAAVYEDIPASIEYTSHCRRIMAALASYVYDELCKCNLKAVRSSGGFYIFADFEIMRPHMERLKIDSASGLFLRMMEEANVALLAAAPALLRPLGELTARVSFTDFDGPKALAASRCIPLSEPLPADFIFVNCSRAITGVQQMTSWVKRICEEQV